MLADASFCDLFMKSPSSKAACSSANNTLSWAQQLAYASPVLTIAFLMGPITILQGIYAKYFGVTLGAIAIVLLISRLFDAVTDPLVGYFSDRCYTRWGSRKPFIVSGGLLFIVSSWFLYVPFNFETFEPATTASAAYFLGWFLAFYLAWTLFEIPHLAWGREISSSSQEKNRVYGWRAMGTFVGMLLFFAIPLMPMFETSAFTPKTLELAVLLAGCSIVPMLYICMKTVPSSKQNGLLNPLSPQAPKKKERFSHALRSIIGNPPLLWFLTAFFCAGIGVGMWFSLIFLFVDSFLGLGKQFALVYVISFGASCLTIGVWSSLASRWGKQNTWGFVMVMIAIGITGTGQLFPGEASRLPLIIFMTLIYSGFAAWTVLAPSLLADIIDYGSWKFGRDHAASYFSLYTLVSKANLAIGGALSLAIAASYGFDATLINHNSAATFGLRMAMAWLPIPIVLLSIFFMARVSINSRRHAIIRRCLDTKARRARGKLDLTTPKALL